MVKDFRFPSWLSESCFAVELQKNVRLADAFKKMRSIGKINQIVFKNLQSDADYVGMHLVLIKSYR